MDFLPEHIDALPPITGEACGALMDAYTRPGPTFTVMVDGTPSSVFGISGTPGKSGCLWYHAVDCRDRAVNPVTFLRASRDLIHYGLAQFGGHLYGTLLCPSEGLLRWVKFLGAEFTREGDRVTFNIQPKP